MRPQHSLHHTNRSKLISLIVILIVLASTTPVLADYIGPNRTVTETVSSGCKVTLLECQYVSAKNDYLYHKVNEWSCSNESKPWQDYPSQPSSQGCSANNIGDQYWDRNETLREVTTTYPAATITGGIQNCTLSNGWCTTAAQLSLSANEPVPGYTIVGIEGTLNNRLFACTGSTCIVPLVEGVNTFTFWAHSSWTDTSEMGNLTAWKDSQPPVITGTLSGVVGLNGWYTSPITINTTTSDAASGVAAVSCTLDGVALNSCKSITVNGEGMHTLTVTARDYANLTRTFTQNSSIDTQNPQLNVSLVGTRSSDTNWYTAASLKGSASDALPGSGISAFQYRLDYGSWNPFPSSGELSLPEGQSTVEVRATDNAGLTASSEKSYWLDKSAPNISVDAAGTLGPNNWYITDLRLFAEATDDLSGLHLLEYSLDDGARTLYSNPVIIGDGIHDVSFWAEDEAGLTSQWNETYRVDTREPIIGGDLSGVPGENGWFISDVILSASAFDPVPGSGLDALTYRLDEGPETSYIDPLVLSDGQHYVQFNARDKADHAFAMGQAVKVDASLPSLNIQTSLPAWIKDSFTIEGTANDNGSGLSKVEISTDGEQTWQAVTGKDSWSYLWNTADVVSGLYQIAVRATDKAGLVTKQTFNTGVDSVSPNIILPASWFQWDTVSLDISDELSGLAESYMEITDPQNRWPARTIRLDAAQFPLQIKWDRRFADDTIAPAGTYDVKVVARDKLGNSAVKSASITILLEILPPGPTATLLPTTLPSPTPTAQHTVTPTAIYTVPPQATNTAIPSVVVKSFGSTAVPGATATPRPVSTSTPPPHKLQFSIDLSRYSVPSLSQPKAQSRFAHMVR